VEKRLLLITGTPGAGKTTVLLRVVEALKSKGYSVGGMISREARAGGVRVGFEIVDLTTGKHGWLARTGQTKGPQVGTYRVNLEDLNIIGVNAIDSALRVSDIVAVDEIGPMELLSEAFKNAARAALKSGKLVIAIVHWKARDEFVDKVKSRLDAETYVVTLGNREHLHEAIVERALSLLSGTSIK
jgi:nucleoside-triphosphatase